MNSIFQRISSLIVVLLSFGLASVGHTAPVELLPESGNSPSFDEGADAFTLGTELATQYSSFSILGDSWTLDGKVRSSVMSGAPANTLGGLTFVYEVENLTAKPAPFIPASATQPSPTQGILNFLVPGWAGAATWVAKSSFTTSSLSTANPGNFIRSNEIIDFTFPPDVGPPAPPIFAQEVSWQLIVHTNATSYTDIIGTINAADFDFSNYIGNGDYEGVLPIGGTESSTTVSTYSVMGTVPDHVSTVALLGLGFSMLLAYRKR